MARMGNQLSRHKGVFALTETVLTLQEEPYRKQVTVFLPEETPVRAAVLYFHGGGLLYGTRDDLPELHRTMLTDAGYAVVTCDYPMGPAADLAMILDALRDTVASYLSGALPGLDGTAPYFLWGRSAGAYLALYLGAEAWPERNPAGVVSFYGYGFLCDFWYRQPSPYYSSLRPVPASALRAVPKQLHCEGTLGTHYSLYVYARQTGQWVSQIYRDKDKYFLAMYSLRGVETYPRPLFACHASADPDVPFDEFTELCNLYDPVRYVVPSGTHDFDRDVKNPQTREVLTRMIRFLDQNL